MEREVFSQESYILMYFFLCIIGLRKNNQTIFTALEKAARQYKCEHGKILTLFIDSADVLKTQEDLFMQLVHEAKVFANAEILTVAFVSSKVSILRHQRILEMADIEDDKAINFLMRNGFSKELGENSLL